MGSSPSKNDQGKSEPNNPAYPAPTPPSYFIDDIKAPIHYYIQERLFEDDGLDWSEVLRHDDPGVEETRRKSDTVVGGTREPRPVLKQPSPATIRPIRSITLLGRDKTGHALRQAPKQTRSSTPNHRSPGLKRKSTPVASSNLPKLDFTQIDRHAQQATKVHRRTYDSLIFYLLQPVRGSTLPEIFKARAIIAWLASQTIKKTLTKADASTPDGLLHMIANSALSYAAAYMLLCRHVGLDCVLIEGVSKSFTYTPSETITEDMKDVWTAVHCEGSWQFVHPGRICKEQDIKNDKEALRNILLDDFFMPAPEYFIHTNYPDEEAWQLLPYECVIPSTDTFLKLPCIFPSFFKLGLQVEGDTNAVMTSNNGLCEIDFVCSHTNDRHLSLTYSLTLIEQTRRSKSNNESTKHLNVFVLHSRQNRRFHFELRLPMIGKYKLEIFESFYGSLQLRLCQFTVICNKTPHDITHLPFTTDHMMWGPGLLCDDAGLLVPSHMVGLVVLPPRSAKERHGNSRGATNYQTATLTFMLHPQKTKDIQFFAYLRRNKTDKLADITGNHGAKRNGINGKLVNEADEISFYANLVSCETNEEKQILEISVRIPHEGEFGLMITKKQFRVDKTTKVKTYFGKENAVCAYFLRATRSALSENVHQRLAREDLVSLIYIEDQKRLQAAISKCRKVLIDENDGDLYRAEMWMEYLRHKTALNDCLHRRNIRVIDGALNKVALYRYKAALQFKIKRVFQLRAQVVRLRSLKQDIPSLKRAATQLATLADPQPHVHVTMAAILLMFGEIEKKVEDWSHIRKQLEHANSVGEAPLFKKIHLIDEICLSKNSTKKVSALLNEYSVDEIRGVSPAALHFHMWAVKTIAIFDETDSVDVPTTPHTIGQGHVKKTETDDHGYMNTVHLEDNEEDSVLTVSNLSQGDVRKESTPLRTETMAFNTVFDSKSNDVNSKRGETVGIQTDRYPE